MIAGLVLCGTGTLPGDSVRFHGSLSPAEIWSAGALACENLIHVHPRFSAVKSFLSFFSDQWYQC